jgi:tight adherence protein C
MLLVLVISVALTLFLLLATVIFFLTAENAVDTRLLRVSSARTEPEDSIENTTTGLGQIATSITSSLKPIRDLISGSDDDLRYRLTLAGFRNPEHVEIYTVAKILLPVLGVIVATYFGNLIIGSLVGIVVGFFGPDMWLGYLITRRQDSIRRALPDALDLLVICMEAGLGIDQAMVRVGDEVKVTSPALSEEIQIINREQRAGKPRLEAWRSMAERVDVDFVRQFVAMLAQTERFGTPIASALGQFADSLRQRRAQAAEELAAKAAVKLLFPLVLFIFPSIFVVTLGPTVINLHKMMQHLFE